jgi:hypothetical protein
MFGTGSLPSWTEIKAGAAMGRKDKTAARQDRTSNLRISHLMVSISFLTRDKDLPRQSAESAC